MNKEFVWFVLVVTWSEEGQWELYISMVVDRQIVRQVVRIFNTVFFVPSRPMPSVHLKRKQTEQCGEMESGCTDRDPALSSSVLVWGSACTCTEQQRTFAGKLWLAGTLDADALKAGISSRTHLHSTDTPH